MRREAEKFLDPLLGNNRTFYWGVVLLIIVIFCGGQKEHTEMINGKLKGSYFVMNINNKYRRM